MIMTSKRKQQIEKIYYDWDKALSNNDAGGLLLLYTEDATLESPLIPHLTGNESGKLKGGNK
jgi:ketosteroid isomerase-like protein